MRTWMPTSSRSMGDGIVGEASHNSLPTFFLTNTWIFQRPCDSSFDSNLSARLIEHYIARTSHDLVPAADSRSRRSTPFSDMPLPQSLACIYVGRAP
ncbi:unnamed protein product [Periconia digitata]|uniref:Uncharacterized protein n=1 Tax=Periconia digitata TaxID=1303443 RepID=A0A9W4U4Y7_9PLEO|nr:unnamed protein product [Periconia digitata]